MRFIFYSSSLNDQLILSVQLFDNRTGECLDYVNCILLCQRENGFLRFNFFFYIILAGFICFLRNG